MVYERNLFIYVARARGDEISWVLVRVAYTTLKHRTFNKWCAWNCSIGITLSSAMAICQKGQS